MKPYYELTEGDVGKPWVKAFGRIWWCPAFIGKVLPLDVGKRVYEVDGVLQVENDEQRAKREARDNDK